MIPIAALIIHAKPIKPVTVPIELIDVPRAEEPKKIEVAPPPPPPAPKPKPKPQNITAPKLLSKPVFETSPLPPTGNTKEEIKEKPVEQSRQPLASLPENPGAAKAGWNTRLESSGGRRQRCRRRQSFAKATWAWSAARALKGVVAGKAGLGRGAKGDGTGGGSGSGEALSGLARPLGGYQVKPRYPESARRAGVQGVTTLRVRVLENGRVGEVLVEQSAGFRDLDFAADGSGQEMALRAGQPRQRSGICLGACCR